MNSIKTMFPCKKKCRRSSRLEHKEKEETQSKTVIVGQLGYFQILSIEVKFHLFSYLSIEDLSILTIVSKAMRNEVETYRGTSYAQKFLLPKYPAHSVIPTAEKDRCCMHFELLGLLMKRSTCLYATKERLRAIQHFMQKYLCSVHKCKEAVKCLALTCYGKFFHTVIAGWDDKECVRAFESVCQVSTMARNLNSIVSCKPGAYPELELQTRLFYRRVFLNLSVSSSEKSFWLHHILQPFPMVHQARVLFLLYGPMCGEDIQWYEMCESTPTSKDQAKICFGDLANAFRVLHHYCKEWTEDDVISVIDEITSSPDDWLAENVANLLYLCGDCITLKVLNSKAINGRMTELASIITSLCLVCTRHDSNISWVIKLVNSVSSILENTRDKLNFLYSIVDMFREVIIDIHEFADTDEESAQELAYMLDAQAEFSKELVLMAYQKCLLS